MPQSRKKSDAFTAIDAHDDTIESILVIPASKLKPSGAVEIVLLRHWEKKRRVLKFTGCANINFSVDMDVLFDNAPNNTAFLNATAKVSEITAAMRHPKKFWSVSYEKGSKLNPLPRKIEMAKQYTLFQVQLFGGVLEIVAKSYQVKSIKEKIRK